MRNNILNRFQIFITRHCDFVVVNMVIKNHCCVKKKCTGINYGEIYLNCSFCQNPIYIECMKKRTIGNLVLEILVMFGLAVKKGIEKYDIEFDDIVKVNLFKSYFSQDSPFAVHCYTCSNKFSNTITDDEDDSKKNEEKSNKNEDESNDEMTVDNKIDEIISGKFEKLKSEIVNEINVIFNTKKSKVNPKIPNKKIDNNKNEILKIYISTDEHNTTPDKVIGLIIENSEIDNVETFSINPMLEPDIAKKRNHQSFELMTVSTKVYDIILNQCSWPNNFTVRKFNKKTTESTTQNTHNLKIKNKNWQYNKRPQNHYNHHKNNFNNRYNNHKNNYNNHWNYNSHRNYNYNKYRNNHQNNYRNFYNGNDLKHSYDTRKYNQQPNENHQLNDEPPFRQEQQYHPPPNYQMNRNRPHHHQQLSNPYQHQNYQEYM